MYIVKKQLEVAGAHNLKTTYATPCNRIHGHDWVITVTLASDKLDENGMVIDFKHLKKAIEECIKDLFDHALILSSEAFRGEAENELLRWAEKYDMRHYVMPCRTTAENMAIHFKELIMCYLNNQDIYPVEVHVRVYETPTSFAEV